jgi:hypothetical protein
MYPLDSGADGPSEPGAIGTTAAAAVVALLIVLGAALMRSLMLLQP